MKVVDGPEPAPESTEALETNIGIFYELIIGFTVRFRLNVYLQK